MVQLQIAFLLVLVVIPIVDVLWSLRKRRVKLALKRQVNTYKWFFTFLWLAYFLPISINLVTYTVSWISPMLTKYSGTSTELVLSFYPIWVLVTIYAVVVFTLKWSVKPIWKYSLEEEAINKEDKDKWNRRYKRVVLFWRKEKSNVG